MAREECRRPLNSGTNPEHLVTSMKKDIYNLNLQKITMLLPGFKNLEYLGAFDCPLLAISDTGSLLKALQVACPTGRDPPRTRCLGLDTIVCSPSRPNRMSGRCKRGVRCPVA
ncbi:MAG: hypothetical protein M1816_006839 [Peltula sp. TS41687]|nr:MAG: hypothetical protein M1816_006839 [Peltula sp. TS41687]